MKSGRRFKGRIKWEMEGNMPVRQRNRVEASLCSKGWDESGWVDWGKRQKRKYVGGIGKMKRRK